MSKWTPALTLLSLVSFSSNLFGWGNGRNSVPPLETVQPTVTHFPLMEDLGWYTKESLLIWKPSEDDLDYGSRIAVKGSSIAPSSAKLKVKSPDFNWSTGARLAIGKYLPHHDQWDIALTTTYFYGTADGKTSANPSQGSVITSNWADTILGNNVLHSSMHWKLNYFTWDLAAGRNYLLTRNLILHPNAGLRAGLFYTDYESTYSQNFILTGGASVVSKTKFKSTDELWGIGPRIAMDLAFNFQKHWAILGNVGVSLLYSGYNVKENIEGAQIVGQGVQPVNLRTSSSGNPLVPNVEGAIGLGWEQWVRKNTVRVAASFMFEATEWFNVNHLYHFEPGNTMIGQQNIPVSQPDKHSGNLGLMGFSVNLQVDF